jgi:hypothetical protein
MEDPITVTCPWCGESFVTFFDASSGSQTYIEDCQVCCRPIQMAFRLRGDGSVRCQAERS